MERTLSVEEKIRRAEQIYAKRHEEDFRQTAKVAVSDKSNKKDIKLLKKLIMQILICVFIYIVIYTIQNSKFIFSEDFINKANEILSYDTNFQELYNKSKDFIMSFFSNINNENNKNNVESENINSTEENNIENNQTSENTAINIQTQAIGGAVENIIETNNAENVQTELSQEEQDINNIKNTTSFIKPIEGIISSRYGHREPTTTTVPKEHTGTDIAANTGTKIKSATDGEVVLASEEGDYGKHLKIQIGDVSIIYAHCNNLYVKQGDKVAQGQEIAEVGSTGNSTGPHLHFEVRYQERTVDPEKLLILQ